MKKYYDTEYDRIVTEDEVGGSLTILILSRGSQKLMNSSVMKIFFQKNITDFAVNSLLTVNS